MQFVVDDYSDNRLHGRNVNLVEATATTLPTAQKPGQWQVTFKTNPIGNVQQQNLYDSRDAAVVGFVDILGTL